MTDAGYTLTETLAAMAVLGLAFGGLSLGAGVIGSLQLSTGQVVKQQQTVRAAQETLEQLLALGAPFGSQAPDQLSGDASGFHFACGAPTPCAAQVTTGTTDQLLKVTNGGTPATTVTLPVTGGAHFAYRGSKALNDVWPPADPGRQALRSVALLQTTDQGDVALLDAKVWAEQPAQCDFDPVMQGCR